jgi:hypothetical protein
MGAAHVALGDAKVMAGAALVGLAAIGNLVRGLLHGRGGRMMEWYVPRSMTHPQNELSMALGFDPQSYFLTPFAGTSTPGMEYFWNAFLKSLLFGEWTTWQSVEIALVLQALLFAIVCYCVGTVVWRLLNAEVPSAGVVLCAGASTFMIAGLIAFRFRFPTPFGLTGPSSNGRYIYPIIVLAAGMCAESIEWCVSKGHKRVAFVGWCCACSFALCGLMFQLWNAYAAVLQHCLC